MILHDNGHIEKMRKTAEKIKQLENLVLERTGDVIEYNVTVGRCIGHGLFNVNNIAVQQVTITSGTIFPIHSHPEKEFLFVYKGSIRYKYSGQEKICNANNSIYFEPWQDHTCEALEDSYLIAITVPASEGYPDANERK